LKGIYQIKKGGMRRMPKCPICKIGNLVDPSELGFDSDGTILICDGEVEEGVPCEFYAFKHIVEMFNQTKIQKFLRKITYRFRRKKVWDIFSIDFEQIACFLTGTEWDFEKVKKDECAVKNCFMPCLYGHWTCKEHLPLELKYFDPVDEQGDLFWSHREKEE